MRVSNWEKVWVELVASPVPLTVAELEKRLGIKGDVLSGLLLKKTKDGTLRRSSTGPRGGYSYEPVSRPPSMWVRLQGKDEIG